MHREVLYDIFIQIFNLNIDYSIIFSEVEEPQKTEILRFVKYVRENHPKEELMKYRISEKSKRIILSYIDYIFKKIDK